MAAWGKAQITEPNGAQPEAAPNLLPLYILLLGGIAVMIKGGVGLRKQEGGNVTRYSKRRFSWHKLKRILKNYSGFILFAAVMVFIGLSKNLDWGNSFLSSDRGTFTCAGKRYCRQMNSCAEAQFYLNTCGVSSLDGDGDGTACDRKCR